jgi:endonuclease/exonuclease/phosphatase family metal-dependent hydrolase
MTKLKIYNHNVRWSSSKKQHLEIVNKIKQLQPDIICLQEVALEKQAKLFEIEGYSSYYIAVTKPRLVALTGIIAPFFNLYKNIENNQLLSTDKINLTKTSNKITEGPKNRSQQFLKGYLLILTRDKPEKVSYKKYKNQGGIIKNLAERVAGKGFLKMEFEGFDIYNTHLLSSHKKKNIELDKGNTEQLAELLKFAKNKKKTILIGDFNFGPNSNKYSLTHDWQDLTREIPVTEYYWKIRLDYIFTNFEPIYSSCNIVQFENEPSDHYGIWCEMEF